MNGCTEFELLLSLQLDGPLAQKEREALAAHLASCPSCRVLQADLLQMHGDLTALRAEPPAELLAQMQAQIFAEQVAPIPLPQQRRSGRRQYRAWFASAAALALVVSAALFAQGRLAGDPMQVSIHESAGAKPFSAMQDAAPAEAILKEGASQDTGSSPDQAAPASDARQVPPAAQRGTAGVAPHTPAAAEKEGAETPAPSTPMLQRECLPADSQNDQASALAAEDNALLSGGQESEYNYNSAFFQLSPEDARAALQYCLEQEPGARPYRSISEAGLDETGQYYRFLVLYPDASEQLYQVSRSDGSVLPAEDPN